jgi:hypothetical protein
MKVSDFVVERLHAWGVRRIYGYPGDGINVCWKHCREPTTSGSARGNGRVFPRNLSATIQRGLTLKRSSRFIWRDGY